MGIRVDKEVGELSMINSKSHVCRRIFKLVHSFFFKVAHCFVDTTCYVR